MIVSVKYFGEIAESIGKTQEEIDLSAIGNTVADLRNYCIRQYQLEDDDSLQLAINQELGLDRPLQEGDEIAFLPPFAGG